jgi:hypothetical protein
MQVSQFDQNAGWPFVYSIFLSGDDKRKISFGVQLRAKQIFSIISNLTD